MVFVRRSVSMSKPLRALAGIAALAMGLALALRARGGGHDGRGAAAGPDAAGP
ncbi:MAG: hypothetical protein H6713_04485 [Myxococcales bacterium]|nr:hypothetical protein [Myxococcales bacterium]